MRPLGPGMLPRGVYRPRYLDREGRPLVMAVDSRSRRIYEVPVPPGADIQAVAAVLERLLDQADPPE